MANPQRENGHLDIANEIADALCHTNLSGYESRILWAIWRKTYGWNKKADMVSYTQLSKLTGIERGHCARTVTKLEVRRLLSVDRSGWHPRIGFQKNWELWDDGILEGVAYIGNNSVANSGNTKSEVLPIQATSVANSGNKVLPIQASTNTNKDNTKNKVLIIVENVLAFWNGLEALPTHRKKGEIWENVKKECRKKLKGGETEEDIKRAIRNYYIIVQGEEYYFDYIWTLDLFFKRGYYKFTDLDIAKKNFRKEDYEETKTNEPNLRDKLSRKELEELNR